MTTLQDYFYSKEDKLEEFPDKGSYVTFYKNFKEFMDKNVHPEIKAVTTRLEDTVFLNDHSSKHVEMVIEKVSYIINDIGIDGFLSLYECFFLLTAIQIHDAGHIINGREDHAETAKKFLKEFNKYTVSAIERKIINKIAKAHSGKNDPIGQLEVEMEVSSFKIRPRLLAALLRLGDELADGRMRGSNYLLDIDQIPVESKLFHVFSRCLDTFKPRMDCHEISMIFYVNKQYATELFKKPTKKGLIDTFLIDEIYIRTVKTFNECIYYNRFVPEHIRLSAVNVNIHFLDDEDDEDFFNTISYRLEEKGYPTLYTENIFELCELELLKDGKRLTGEFIKSSLENNNSYGI